MNGRRIKAMAAGTAFGALLAGLAVAGEDPPLPPQARAQRDALVNAFFVRMDTNKDAKVSRAEAELASKSLFAKLDGNGDGVLAKAEVEAAALALRAQELADRYAKLDVDHDGRLTLEESKLPAAVFSRLDTNTDRAVTLPEFRAVLGAGGGRPPLDFERADTNRDGKVTLEESARAARERFDQMDTNKDASITRPELEARVNEMMRGPKGSAPAAPAK